MGLPEGADHLLEVRRREGVIAVHGQREQAHGQAKEGQEEAERVDQGADLEHGRLASQAPEGGPHRVEQR